MQLLNRQKRAKKTPIPLTNDMLNELKVNHMGGADNYGVDDFYNIDDPWNDTKQPIKPKVSKVMASFAAATNAFLLLTALYQLHAWQQQLKHLRQLALHTAST